VTSPSLCQISECFSWRACFLQSYTAMPSAYTRSNGHQEGMAARAYGARWPRQVNHRVARIPSAQCPVKLWGNTVCMKDKDKIPSQQRTMLRVSKSWEELNFATLFTHHHRMLIKAASQIARLEWFCALPSASLGSHPHQNAGLRSATSLWVCVPPPAKHIFFKNSFLLLRF
jgi:hypothetical protein